MGRRIAALGLTLALFAGANAGSAQAAAPPPLTITALGETVRATQGSYCWRSKARGRVGIQTAECGDSLYPLEVRCRLPVAPGARIKVRTGAAVRKIDFALVGRITATDVEYLDWNERRRSRKGREVWRLTLPDEVVNASAIDISIRGRRGDSNTWTGLATQPCAEIPPS